MKTSSVSAILGAIFLSSTVAFAGEQTVKLSVPGMNCASCPFMVEVVISDVEGVKTVETTLKDRTATVTFDDAETSVDAIRAATAGIGYASTLITSGTDS